MPAIPVLSAFALASPSVPPTGLAFLLPNNAANNDIGLEWTGANLLDRTTHTALWKINYIQQTGFYALCWHCHNDATFHGNSDYGTHPYPCDNTVLANGSAAGPTGSSGTAHSFEIAGLAGNDFLCTSGGPNGLVVTKGVEYWQARTCELITAGTVARHTFYPDVQNNPSFSIQQDCTVALINTDPAITTFRFGVSPWRSGLGGGGAGSNDEVPSCTYLRFIKLYSTTKTLTEIQAKFTDISEETNDGARWYSCINPTPTDITDKSGMGHTPAWANALRPTAWP